MEDVRSSWWQVEERWAAFDVDGEAAGWNGGRCGVWEARRGLMSV